MATLVDDAASRNQILELEAGAGAWLRISSLVGFADVGARTPP
jgi:hypothetical protein